MEIYRSLPVTLHLHIHKYHRELYHFLVCKIFGCNILPRHIFSQFNSYSILWLELMSWTTAYLSNVTTHSAAWAIFMWLPSPNSVYCCVYHSSCCLCNGTLHAATYTMKAMDEQIPKKCIEEKNIYSLVNLVFVVVAHSKHAIHSHTGEEWEECYFTLHIPFRSCETR